MHRELGGISQEFWLEYAQRLDIQLSENTINDFTQAMKGRPVEMATLLALMATNQGKHEHGHSKS